MMVMVTNGNVSLWTTDTTSADQTPNTTSTSVSEPPCQWILYSEINNSKVRIWDVIIFGPNLLFLFFLLFRLRTTFAKLRHSNSPIFCAFYCLVFSIALISVLRCIVSMSVNAAVLAADIADKVLWLMLRFFLLATELSVVVFGLAFGHLDSRTSIQWVVLITFSVALIYSSTQGVLEFMFPDDRFHVHTSEREYDIFGHGGMLFWFTSSIFFFVIYAIICFLPFTRLKERFALPSKNSFYWYCLFLAILNVLQACGSGLLYYQVVDGMCVVDLTAYIYFTCFAALVYWTFLRDFFTSSQPTNILFSYKAHYDDDDDEEDTVHMPQQSYRDSAKSLTAGDIYDSTEIDDDDGPNPLYTADLHLAFSPELSVNTEYFAENLQTGVPSINNNEPVA